MAARAASRSMCDVVASWSNWGAPRGGDVSVGSRSEGDGRGGGALSALLLADKLCFVPESVRFSVRVFSAFFRDQNPNIRILLFPLSLLFHLLVTRSSDRCIINLPIPCLLSFKLHLFRTNRVYKRVNRRNINLYFNALSLSKQVA